MHAPLRKLNPPDPEQDGVGGAEPLNVALVGGGPAACRVLDLLEAARRSGELRILGLLERDAHAPAVKVARELGLQAAESLEDLLHLPGLDLVFDLSGSPDMHRRIERRKPPGVSLLDARSALWLASMLEKAPSPLPRPARKHTQVILDSLPYRLMVINLDMTIDTVNQTFLRQLQLKAEDVIGRHCYQVQDCLNVPCQGSGEDCHLFNRLDELHEKGLISIYKETVGAQGESRFDVITVAPIYDSRERIVQLVVASRDVTDRIKLEKELQKSNTFLERVIQSTVDGIVVVDTKGNVLIFNEGMERLTGYSAGEMVHRGHLSDFYDMETARENMRKMRSDGYGGPGKLNPTPMTLRTREGEEIPVTLTASIIHMHGREAGSVGVFTDMREILHMRKELEEAHLQLVQSEKIASVGRMAAGVAHEINNPLSGILMFAELLKENLPPETQGGKDVQEIIEQTLRCKKIVAELLEFSRQSVGRVTSFPVAELVDKSLNILIHQASFQDIDVKVTVQPDMPFLVGDMAQLQQVLTNLFLNAADAMDGRGRLEVEARFDPESNRFTLIVADTGPGIPGNFRDKVFDIFFTSKPVGKGTGLGLSICRNIIELHGGTIGFECPPGGGTRFIIELPLGLEEKSGEEPVFL